MKYGILLLVFMASFQCHLEALPAQILIIRHAEKPKEGDSLSTKGRERAAALAPYFIETEDLLKFETPIAIFAAAASKDDPSKRSVETVQLLAEKLKQSVIDTFERDDYKKMVDEIKKEPSFNGRSVLICWEHKVIPEIARAFGALQTPAKWPGEVFDRVWLITFSSTGKATFQNLPQKLMFGDSSN